jgi:hypothetical protein
MLHISCYMRHAAWQHESCCCVSIAEHAESCKTDQSAPESNQGLLMQNLTGPHVPQQWFMHMIGCSHATRTVGLIYIYVLHMIFFIFI